MTKVLHSVHDKNSREFLQCVPMGIDILNDSDSVRNEYPYISAFPTVVFDVKDKVVPEHTENEITIPEYTIPAHTEYLRSPANWEEVESEMSKWELS